MSLEKQNMFVGLGAMVLIAAIAAGSPSAAIDSRDKMRQEAAEQSAKAASAFDAIMQVPDKAIPRELLDSAKAIAVFPHVVKVAVTIGGEGGRGVVSRRDGDGWGPPVYFRGDGASFGPQAGAASIDFVMLLMNDESIAALMKDRFELGGDLGVAAGPVGRHMSAGTDALMHAAILSYSRSRGVFAGADVKGIVIKPEDSLNLAVYDKTAEELLKEPPGGVAPTASALIAFPAALGRYTAKQ